MEKSIVDTSQVVLVDLNDRPTGYMEKQEAHRQGLLHRAISVFLFNKDNGYYKDGLLPNITLQVYGQMPVVLIPIPANRPKEQPKDE